MRTIRLVTTVMRSADTYRRWAYLVLGGALFLPFLIAVLVATSVLVQADLQQWGAQAVLLGVMSLGLAAALGGVMAGVPGVHQQQAQLARVLLRGPLAADPPITSASPRARVRGGVWLALHLTIGFAVSVVTMIGLTEAAQLAVAPVVPAPDAALGRVLPGVGAAVNGPGRWLGPAAAIVVLVVLLHLVALVGWVLARLAPVLIGPSTSDRLVAAQQRADDLTRRNHLAAELHDSIGHALSVVTLQAGTAARLVDHDPAFAREALAAIAEQARTATAELDHVLGLLRDQPAAIAPARSLAQLPTLIDAAQTTGADLRFAWTGSLDAVPPVLSREAYRLCQEGITNALRHGDGSAPVTVELHVDSQRLRLCITNPTRSGRSRSRPGGGHGLAQMGERIRLLGGDLQAGVQDRTWQLIAHIPLGGAT